MCLVFTTCPFLLVNLKWRRISEVRLPFYFAMISTTDYACMNFAEGNILFGKKKKSMICETLK